MALDTLTKEKMDTALIDLWKHYEFFLPLAGHEKYQIHQDNPADTKAAEKMARIYDEIIKNNPEIAQNKPHSLNVFLTRLLFCFFAEDTGIFEGQNMFTKILAEHTREDGSDISDYLKLVFQSMDQENKSQYPWHLQQLPYVNGSLFSEVLEIPKISAKTRQLMIECGELDWQNINPDIFGSMFQAVSLSEVRSSLGQHYTSVPNIMKVIEPLFLNRFREEFDALSEEAEILLENRPTAKKINNMVDKLKALWDRLAKIRVFDPACGSGNFLIIAYKQLRILEMDIILLIRKLEGGNYFAGIVSTRILLKNFYGIEIDDFACEIAILSLWLAEHQMNCRAERELGNGQPTLPLKPGGNIFCANALEVNWNEICPQGDDVSSSEVYILGNPPYLGTDQQNARQKKELEEVFKGIKNVKSLDYVACWFYRGVQYISDHPLCQFAFVATNSICQGQQVGNLWPHLLNDSLEIAFAHQSFKWVNNARKNAGVTCVIIGIRNKNDQPKFLYKNYIKTTAKNINPYLSDATDTIVKKRNFPLSDLPRMIAGNKPVYGNNLILNEEEKNKILKFHSEAKDLFHPFKCGEDFIEYKTKWCLWINTPEKLKLAESIDEIQKRIEKTRKARLESTDAGARKLALRPHQFRDMREAPGGYIIVPCTTSENRDYIPMGYLSQKTIINNAANAVYNPPGWLLGVLTSRMHMVWVRANCGRLKTDYRYSANLCYNTFPFTSIDEEQKDRITRYTDRILLMRDMKENMGMSYAELYNNATMPANLRAAHQELDLVIDQCYRKKPFADDKERLEFLQKLYVEMTAAEENNK